MNKDIQLSVIIDELLKYTVYQIQFTQVNLETMDHLDQLEQQDPRDQEDHQVLFN